MLKNSLNELRTLEQYFTNMLVEISSNSAKVLPIPDDILAQKTISAFITGQVKELRKQITEKDIGM